MEVTQLTNFGIDIECEFNNGVNMDILLDVVQITPVKVDIPSNTVVLTTTTRTIRELFTFENIVESELLRTIYTKSVHELKHMVNIRAELEEQIPTSVYNNVNINIKDNPHLVWFCLKNIDITTSKAISFIINDKPWTSIDIGLINEGQLMIGCHLSAVHNITRDIVKLLPKETSEEVRKIMVLDIMMSDFVLASNDGIFKDELNYR